MNEISKNLMCVVIRGGIEIWIEKEKAENLIKILKVISGSKFIDFNGQIINTADITGIFTPEVMADKTRRKNGQWVCGAGTWHDRFQKCECKTVEENKAWVKGQEDYFRTYGVYPLP